MILNPPDSVNTVKKDFWSGATYWTSAAGFGCLAVEMETAELYTLAAKYRREALALLTISDSLLTHEATSAEERQTAFTRMMEVALETAIS